MTSPRLDAVFAGSIPKLYDTHLVPLLFEPYAADLMSRLRSMSVSKVLEMAAGTGVVSRALAATFPDDVSIVATDLNQAMLDWAAAAGTQRPIEWRQANAMELPFPDATFDTVICQFGAMFFPDKPKAFSEARRVLKRGGVFLFNVWDRLEDNEFADAVTTAMQSVFPDDPPQFLRRTPYGYHDPAVLARDLAGGGFTASPQISTVVARSRATAAQIPAIAFCQGTPLRNEIEARDASRLGEATDAATQAIASRFGSGPVDGKIQARIVVIAS